MGNRNQKPAESDKNEGSKKRTHDEAFAEDEQDERERIERENLLTPKKIKLKSTSQYIYDTLFINGESSDVQIVAFGKEWKLHKVYLCQANYFSSMFSGSWKESQEGVIHMDIPDENIDLESLNMAFGSLYSDDMLISATRVIPALAAATLLGMDGLIQQCVTVMQETVSSKTVCSYHTAACMYAQQATVSHCEEWLHKNLMYQTTPALLTEISCSLMEKVVKHPQLFVMQVEMDIYSLLKKWMFLQITSNNDVTHMKQLTAVADTHWKSRLLDADVSEPEVEEFLVTEEGEKYTDVFRTLRLPHIINDLASAKIVESDKILPMSWLMPMYKQQWLQMIKVEQGHDKGPLSLECSNFDEVSMRCGRILLKDGDYCWRWTGYNFGMDLLVSFSSRLLLFKRNTHSQPCPGGVSLHANRHILYRLTICSLDSLGHSRYHKTTEIKRLELIKDEESVITGVDRNVPFPLHISCQFLVFTPRKNYVTNPTLPT